MDFPQQRTFRIWHYSTSHSTLVLRSLDDTQSPRRVEVAFFGVRALHLREVYPAFSIIEDPSHQVIDVSGLIEPGEPMKCFRVNDGPDYVLATAVASHVDEGDYRSPSHFGPLPGLV